MKVAAFNGFDFHHEMYGYIIHYCLIKNYELTIYLNDLNNNEGYVEWYKQLFGDSFKVKTTDLFVKERHEYDKIFLLTDDDYKFDDTDPEINGRTICIDHFFQIRRPAFERRIATRPFDQEHARPCALPTYPIVSAPQKREHLRDILGKNEIHILILGHMHTLNIGIINRIKSADSSKTVFHVACRNPTYSQYPLSSHVYPNLSAIRLFELAVHCNYIIGSDISENKDYIKSVMSGSVPYAFTTMTPLIICKQANEYYKFKNVIEYEKQSTEDIVLYPIDLEAMEQERATMIAANHGFFDV
jgi:hypothetical protein